MYLRLSFLTLSLAACGYDETHKTDIDPELKPYVDSFFEDCANSPRAIDCWRMAKDLESVKWTHEEDRILGKCTTRRVRRVDPLPRNDVSHKITIDYDTKYLKLVIYHELGHALGLDHDDNSCIMATYTSPKSAKYAEDNWQKCVEELFQ